MHWCLQVRLLTRKLRALDPALLPPGTEVVVNTVDGYQVLGMSHEALSICFGLVELGLESCGRVAGVHG